MLEAMRFVLGEHFMNINKIKKIAIVNMNKQTIRTSFGIWWVYIHDVLYFSMFILFRILMAGNGPIEGMHNIVYLVTGLIPWFFMNEVLGSGSLAIKANKAIIQSLKYQITIIPTTEVLSIFLKRVFTFALIFIVTTYYGYLYHFNIVLFLYYVLCMVILMWALNLLISAYVAVSSDFHQLYITIIRVLMFSLPIMWSFDNIRSNMLTILLKINPMVYVLIGFRDAFVLGKVPNMIYTIYFWLCVLVLFSLGSLIQFKIRKYYSDFM